MNLLASVAIRSVTILLVLRFWPSVAIVLAGLWALYDGTRTEFGKLVVTWFLTLFMVVLVGGGRLLNDGVFGWAWVFVAGTVLVSVAGAAVGSLFAKEPGH